jgi:hypothetical protein
MRHFMQKYVSLHSLNYIPHMCAMLSRRNLTLHTSYNTPHHTAHNTLHYLPHVRHLVQEGVRSVCALGLGGGVSEDVLLRVGHAPHILHGSLVEFRAEDLVVLYVCMCVCVRVWVGWGSSAVCMWRVLWCFKRKVWCMDIE